MSRMSARLTHENTYLSYTRNAVISTVAGGALVQYHKNEGRPPLAGAGLLTMGGLFMYCGSVLYLRQVFELRRALQFGPWSVGLSVLNACWPCFLWSISLACLLDETPSWLLEGLRLVEGHLPSAVRTSLFLDPAALYPLCRLLNGVIEHEEGRLNTARRHAMGYRSLTKPYRAPLTDLDVMSIIARRRERLIYIKNDLYRHARSDRTIPTAIAAPLLDKLRVEVQQLEKVLESDLAPQRDWPPALWWVLTKLSKEHGRLRAEIEEVRALQRRIAAVKFAAGEFAARGQVGVPEGGREEKALATRRLSDIKPQLPDEKPLARRRPSE